MTSSIRHILLDIEGTTCPVSFVSEVLFPYAGREAGAYLTRHGHDREIQELLADLLTSWKQEEDEEARALLRNSEPIEVIERPLPEQPSSDEAERLSAALVPYLHWLIRRDRKVTAWKDLQGRIWKEGYARGELQATLFPEVAQSLRHWKQKGLALSVYSSGSVAAQQLLYGHSEDGDLRPLFSHWFDTRIGSKHDEGSYRAIVEILGLRPEEVLFISDSTGELKAAQAAGLRVLFSDREGNPQRDPEGFASLQSLQQVAISECSDGDAIHPT